MTLKLIIVLLAVFSIAVSDNAQLIHFCKIGILMPTALVG